jgi:predicted ArsR family transcriptional regulator
VEQGDPDQALIQFVLDHLETVPHLEALLLIWQNQATGWTADVLAGRIYVSHAVARGILEDFRRHGFVTSEGQPEPIYVFDTGWDADRQLMSRLADLYRRQLVQVTKLIHSKGSSSVREFARAFKINKDH